MRNAALFALLIPLLAAAAIGMLASPVVAIAAIICAAAVGIAIVSPAQKRARKRVDVETAEMPSHTIAVDVVPAGRDRAELEDGLRMVCDVIGARAAVLWRTDPSNDLLRAVAAHGRALPAARTLRGDPLTWIAREGLPMRIDPPPQWAESDARVNAIRLWSRDTRSWILAVELPIDDDLPLSALTTVGAPVRLLVELQERRTFTDAEGRRLADLLDALHRIPVATELEPAAKVLIDACLHLTGGTGGAVGVWDGEEGRIVGVVGTDGGPKLDAVFRSPTSELALAVRAGEPLVRAPGTWKPGDTQIATHEDRWDTRIRTFAAIPMRTASDITSVLALWSTRDQELDPRGLELVSAIAPYAALHLKHARDFGRMKETASTDALTGLRNRRAFDDAMTQETLRYDRYQRPVSLLMIDMDHFKAVNDKHGHEAGDEVLRRAAEIVRSCVRELDTAARFGGEEMAVLLPETPAAYAREVAERIRNSVRTASIIWNQRSIPVTVSIGVSSVPEHVASVAALVASADEALYKAKTGGRNQVVG